MNRRRALARPLSMIVSENFLFPTVFAAIRQANATLMVAISPLIGLLAAIFILPEIYGYEND